jgi:NADPH:quinone reductase-like Zn-dependent oxidoreductase
VDEKAVIAQSLAENVWPVIEAGTVKPLIHSTFSLLDASEAHALMDTSAHIGKIVLTV